MQGDGETAQVSNCKLRGMQETKVTKGACFPEHRMMWNVQVQRFPNNQHKVVSDR